MSISEWISAMPEAERLNRMRYLLDDLATLGQAEELYTLLTMDELDTLLTSYDLLKSMADVIGVEDLSYKYSMLTKSIGMSLEKPDIYRVADALRASIVRLKQAPDELWNQVKGRADVALHTHHPRPVPRLDFRCATLMSADPALLYILQGHTGNVTACALSADGKLALSASVDGTLRLWDTTSGETVRILQGHTVSVTACALSANGQVALSGDEYGMLRLWDTAKGETVYSVPSPKSLTFKQQEQERATGKTLLGHTGKVTACALSANGQVALSGDEYGRLLLWGTTSRVVWHNWSSSHNKVEKSVLSADGMRALTCSRDSNSILSTRILRLWDTTSGETLRIWKFPIFWEVADCALSADGLRLFAVSNLMGFRAKLEVWDTSSGRRIRKLKGFKGGVGSCALSDDGHVALSGARTAFLSTLLGNMATRSCLLALIGGFSVFDNYEGSTLRVWDTKSGKTQRILQGHKDSVALCALSEDGKLALSGSSKLVELEEDDTSLADPSEHCALRLWNTASNEATYTPHERNAAPVSGCVLSANGHRALTFTKNDGALRVWDTASGQTLHILKHKQAVASCALSADGKLALSVCYDSGLRLWDTESGKTLHTWLYHIIGMKGCSLSADGRWALSLRVDGFLYLWDTINGQTLTQFLPEEKPDEGYRRWTINFAGRGFALSADGCRALFVSKDGALQIWNREDIQEPSILEESLNNVDNWALSTDGQRVVAASEDGTLRIWNTESRHVLHALKGHTGIVPMCSLSANGRLALSASWDHTLRLWDTTSGQEIMRWTHDIALCSCSLSADGRVAVAGDIDGSVHFLEVVGVAKAKDIAAAKLPVSWLAEKSQSKPSLLRQLFGRHRRLNIGEKKEGEAEVLISGRTVEKPLHIFCCYVRADQSYLLELRNCLIPFQRAGLLMVHADVDVSPGENWEQKIHSHLNTAHIILLLVSPDFLASDYCRSTEMARALERHRKGNAQVIPIILRPVDLLHLPFSTIQALPTNAQPIVKWRDRDGAFLNVANGIRGAMEKLFGHVLSMASVVNKEALIYEQKAKGYNKQRKYREALGASEQAIHLDPANSNAYVNKSDALYGLRLYNEALDASKEAIRLDPANSDAYVSKNAALYGLHLYNEALDASKEAIRLDPNNSNAYVSKGVALAGQRRYDETLIACEQAIRLDPNNSDAYGNKSAALYGLERYSEALKASEQAIHLDPNNSDVYICKCSALYGLERYSEALKASEQAIHLDPNNHKAHNWKRAISDIGEKKEKEAEVLINEGPAENVHVNEQAQQRAFTLKAKKPGEMGEGRKRDRFAKFTERARKVLSFAQEEAQRFRHNYIGTEHLLLGLVRESEGVAAKVLSNLGVELNKVHSAVELIIGRGDRIVPGEIGLTPRAKGVIELAVDEARLLNQDYIGPEHLLLGLVREGEGIAAGVLESLGVTLEDARTQTMMILGAYETLSQPDQQEPVQHASPHEVQEQGKGLGNTTRKRESGPLEDSQPLLPSIGDQFNAFTEQARNILSLAQEEARHFQHGYIGTEHLLLGLIREDEGVAAKVLNGLGVKLDKIHAAVEYIIGRGDCIVPGEISLTPRAKRMIELAADEARLLNHDYIGPEHLLLGLVRLGEGIGAGVLQTLGINIEEVRTQTLQMLYQRKVEEGNNS